MLGILSHKFITKEKINDENIFTLKVMKLNSLYQSINQVLENLVMMEEEIFFTIFEPLYHTIDKFTLVLSDKNADSDVKALQT